MAGRDRPHSRRRPLAALADFLTPYLEAIRRVNGGDDLLVYPGSPAIATVLGRLQDRFVFGELHPLDADDLAARFAGDRRVEIAVGDGFVLPRAKLPPIERRGLLVVDPPFEEAGEFARLARAMTDAHRRFATGAQLVWYPIKDEAAVAAFHDAVAASPIKRVLRIAHRTRRPETAGPLVAAGIWW